eukprot:CAMPEP_0198732866 /NCGR_PEP_ID=MMETSP1475-20131203/40190_1 /TAXON_ID= ORGANISM="Unidentified sp., Strain CCMP1999" /NCGR_SAMPLE_ID=MMETSP1475 /ASSEMBLY_ACC=CAM_ASM_001111 /LENGTH=179 /DNA_ID=CAMNT_0044496047 /DNA_START=499 /DNA_END=1038 /DNA_ORIENTATION=-
MPMHVKSAGKRPRTVWAGEPRRCTRPRTGDCQRRDFLGRRNSAVELKREHNVATVVETLPTVHRLELEHALPLPTEVSHPDALHKRAAVHLEEARDVQLGRCLDDLALELLEALVLHQTVMPLPNLLGTEARLLPQHAELTASAQVKAEDPHDVPSPLVCQRVGARVQHTVAHRRNRRH